MKSTLVCVHVMPREIELFERFMYQYKRALLYLDQSDSVTIKASLNLNPELTDWVNSELTPEYFINKFEALFEGVPNINEIILDNNLMGTTQQKRESIYLEYDQFIFVDADIAFPEQLLKTQLEASYLLEGKYILIPNIIKLWDDTWDVLVHPTFLSKSHDYYKTHPPELTINQEIQEVALSPSLSTIKFGCGMHTLYSKEFWNFIDIPEFLGGYGPEDTFAMFASIAAKQKGHKINQHILEGIYITEDYINRIPSFEEKIQVFNRKQEFRDKAESRLYSELEKFKQIL